MSLQVSSSTTTITNYDCEWFSLEHTITSNGRSYLRLQSKKDGYQEQVGEPGLKETIESLKKLVTVMEIINK